MLFLLHTMNRSGKASYGRETGVPTSKASNPSSKMVKMVLILWFSHFGAFQWEMLIRQRVHVVLCVPSGRPVSRWHGLMMLRPGGMRMHRFPSILYTLCEQFCTFSFGNHVTFFRPFLCCDAPSSGVTIVQ